MSPIPVRQLAARSGQTNGSGSIADTVNMPVGSSITYTVTSTLATDAVGQVTNTATVAAPDDLVETDPSNNSVSDSDTITTTVDLAVTKTDNVTVVRPNDVLTYEIVVSNAGPSDALGATLIDLFPAELTNVSYTSMHKGAPVAIRPAVRATLTKP